MAFREQNPNAAGTDNGDPLATLMRARQLIHDAQQAIEEASQSVVQQRASSGEIPEREARLARAENDREELATRLLEVEHQVGRLMTLYVATYQLHATLDPADVQSTIAEIAVNLIGAQQFALLLRNEDGSALEIRMQEGNIDAPWSSAATYSGGDPLVDAALLDGVLRFGPVEGSPVLVVVPLRVQDVTVGALLITRLLSHKAKLDEEDREILDLLGAHAASALFASRVYARAARKLRTLEDLIKLVKKG
ncbi:MAG: GAF domain-containing protein [Deltaproteobacteria bacterium]|jgi:GAF domain-containing protein|nr:GAF domain-containing protein [Deltaproteobacteria bacterium]